MFIVFRQIVRFSPTPHLIPSIHVLIPMNPSLPGLDLVPDQLFFSFLPLLLSDSSVYTFFLQPISLSPTHHYFIQLIPCHLLLAAAVCTLLLSPVHHLLPMPRPPRIPFRELNMHQQALRTLRMFIPILGMILNVIGGCWYLVSLELFLSFLF